MKTLTTIAGVAALLCLSALSAKAATLTNWARGGIATQSTTYSEQGNASRAIDGNVLGGWSDSSTSHTADSENNAESHPWWEVDLQEAKSISHLHLWFREDCCQIRNDNLRIVIFDSTNVTTRVVLWETNNVAMNGAVPRDIGFDVTPAVSGRVVHVEHLPEQDTTQNFICITELEAFNQPLTALANYARDGTATSSSCYVSDCDLYGPQQAIDGNHHGWTSVTGWPFAYSAPDNTAGVDPLPWWNLEFPTAKTVGSVVLWPRHDRTYARYDDIRLTVADQNNATLYQQVFTIQPNGPKFVVNFVPALANAKTVKIETTTNTSDTFLNLPEVEVFAPLSSAPTIAFTKDLQPIALNENLTPTFGPVAVTVDGGIRPEDISYRWYRNGVEIPNLAGSWLPSYTTPTRVGPSSSGDKYKVQASVSGYGVFSSEVALTVTADTIPPVLKYATGDTSFTKLRVWFSEPVDPTSAQKVSNYQLSGGLTVTSATLSAPVGSPGDNIVDLVTSAQTPGQTYTLTVTGVKDQSEAGNLVAAGSTVQFTSWVVASGFLRFEVWNGLSTTDNSLTNTLTADSRFPNSPDYVAFTTALSSRPVYADDTHEGYGGKMSGFIVPTETADYRFFLYSDDSSQLYLSTNADSQAKVLICEETDCCDVFAEPGTLNDDGVTSPTSEPAHLVAGQRYYVEALWKEGTGGDYCQVAWRKEGDATAASSLTAIPSQYLATYVDPNTDLQFVIQPTDQPGVVPSSGTEIFVKDFNADDGGFTVVNTETAPPGPWIYDSTAGTWTADGSEDGCTGPYNSQLSSPAYKLTQDGVVSLEFDHRYSFESGLFDAGLVRISVNGGAFTLVPAENFSANGYAAGAIVGNGIALGLRGFNADSPGYADGQFVASKATLGTFSKDDTLVVQFVGAWDECSSASHPNWVINGMKLQLLPMIIQDFRKGDGGFTVENTTPAPPGPWAYSSTNGLWATEGGADDCTGPYNSKLTSPSYTVPQADEVTLSFTHRYAFESDYYDGGQIRISVNGSAFTAVPAENFSANGYLSGAMVGSGVLKGERAFNGTSTGYATNGFITSSAVLGTFKQNDKIVVQFLGAWDECSVASRPGWVIKNMQLVFGKAAKPTTFEAKAAATLRGEAVSFTYQWQRNDGAGFVNIPNATGATFTIYPTAADFKAQFRVVASVPGKTINSMVAKITEGSVATPEISIKVSGGVITITFTGTLQSSTSVLSGYQNVNGAQSPYTVPNPQGAMFFRSVK